MSDAGQHIPGDTCDILSALRTLPEAPRMSPAFAQLAQLTINGMAIGAIYALVALGLVLTYKATEVLNFAHGDVLMASSFVGWGLIVGLGWPFWLAALTTVALAALLSWVIDARVMRLIVGQPQFAGVMLTIAIAFMLRGLVSMAFGPEAGLRLMDEIADAPALKGHALLAAARGDCMLRAGRTAEARAAFERAAELTQNARERQFLLGRAAACG